MNSTLIFRPDVLLKWKRLDFELQELALDGIENAMDSPPDPADPEAWVIIIREVGNRTQRLELRLGWVFSRQVVVVVNLDLSG